MEPNSKTSTPLHHSSWLKNCLKVWMQKVYSPRMEFMSTSLTDFFFFLKGVKLARKVQISQMAWVHNRVIRHPEMQTETGSFIKMGLSPVLGENVVRKWWEQEASNWRMRYWWFCLLVPSKSAMVSATTSDQIISVGLRLFTSTFEEAFPPSPWD